ncbi:uncharacterized protein BCR38DRAFT_54247 [Pseudomassariella vexata]|uniref:Zn(2)-C6 fungal-type domain-containing protein n=1 Tax=Pseudomassariella vexata TaxID=1141098 RepID=A0A1Y2DLI2_9PEZI|nr:uncharacterized protein BCR38DRAFT_54247 [Pseudomassariella vexata]ORY60123.1 hypothetical protein BCR38DRAFT_54247 [Pseudomassariella vexata]
MAKRLRLACDHCHKSKIRCSGGDRCAKCRELNLECQYSYMATMGKPRGRRNHKTLHALAASASRGSPQSGMFRGSSTPSIPPSQKDHLVSLNPQCTGPISEDNVREKLGIKGRELWDPSENFPIHSPPLSTINARDELLGSMDVDWTSSEWQYLSEFDLGFYMAPSLSNDAGVSCLPRITEQAQISPSDCCLSKLTDHICQLDHMERQQSMHCVDATFDKAMQVSACIQNALACHFCRLNSKVLLLSMIVLETVLNWISFESVHIPEKRHPPVVNIGKWTLPDSYGCLVITFLTARILDNIETVVKGLGTRIDEFSLEKQIHYQSMDMEAIKQSWLRLEASMKKLVRLAEAV